MFDQIKGYLLAFLFVFTIGNVVWFFIIRKEVKEYRIKKTINSEILKGNKIAIAIKCENYSWMISPENEELIMAALEGNEGAIKALRINVDRPNRNY
jgi:hypothetical protein